MDKNTFESAEPIVDEIADAIGPLLESAETKELCSLLAKLHTAIGNRYAVSLAVHVDVWDREKERSLPLLQTGIAGFDGEKPYQTWADSTPQRYIVDGDMLVVPHDRCPKCWELWDSKFEHRSCPHCDATLGRDVKLLLDTDECPHCETGKVSMTEPTCPECGFCVDPSLVVWG